MNSFELWTTDHLGDTIRRMRQTVREAQEAFAASQQEDRRKINRRAHTDGAYEYARRLADELALMKAELRRRTIAAVVESEVTL